MITNIRDNLDDTKSDRANNNDNFINKLYQITTSIIECYKKGGKLIFAGNGGVFLIVCTFLQNLQGGLILIANHKFISLRI